MNDSRAGCIGPRDRLAPENAEEVRSWPALAAPAAVSAAQAPRHPSRNHSPSNYTSGDLGRGSVGGRVRVSAESANPGGVKTSRSSVRDCGTAASACPRVWKFTGRFARIRAVSGCERALTYAPPPPIEYLARRDVVAYFVRVLAAGGRVILTPAYPYFGIIPGWRMGPEICVRCRERPVRLPLGRRRRRASTCTVCGHRRRERTALFEPH